MQGWGRGGGGRVGIGVRVGGLPREVFGVSGTSVVHYELIRRMGGRWGVRVGAGGRKSA